MAYNLDARGAANVDLVGSISGETSRRLNALALPMQAGLLAGLTIQPREIARILVSFMHLDEN